ncbi:hypothetical protein A5320_13400 [Rheinheimera sp. SA_1]|jgi:hypothetical protein|uniref:hypothetical protein n=1 Tax=Rheinheimera sp. SA_1 TaxID=1827365 RepID=UPI0007FE8CB3|nr:hypothetical protein [Rheinheimera sp. SA_1]OBP14719.1 hypothetical protein A5320_13400 [Rheinheimera sp. SA_1]
MNKFTAPKRWLNASLFYIGCFGAVFQLTAQLYSWWIGLGLFTEFWWTWPAPVICILWGLVPSLQLQVEPQPQKPQSTFEV